MNVQVKICGLRTAEAVAAAVDGGAAFVGFVFFAKSPRCVTAAEAGALVHTLLPSPDRFRPATVGLFVDPDDTLLNEVLSTVPLDIIQLHGHEPPERVAAIKARHGLPVMKAIPLAVAADLNAARPYSGIADMFLFDAKPPPDAEIPGGNALPFDWTILAGAGFRTPWMLAGGLTAQNVRRAVERTGTRMIDVSSGVESSRGIKDPALIREFLAVTGAHAPATQA